MEIGVTIPHFGPLASPQLVPEFCRRAEAAGFDGLWAVEHLVVPREMSSTYTLARRPVVIEFESMRATMGLNLEMTTTLAVAAAVTSRVRLGSAVAVLPLHNPVMNARQLATIDLYSGGRLVYGAGVGWLKEEAEAMGMPWDRRGARAEEHIALMRSIWGATGETVSFDGEFYSFPAMDPDPRPERPIPILVGGHSDVALDRAARVGDGWIAAGMSPDRLQGALATLRDACARHGRDPSELWIVCGTTVHVDVEGGAGAIEARLRQYEELGVDHAMVAVVGDTGDALLDALDRWEPVLDRVR